MACGYPATVLAHFYRTKCAAKSSPNAAFGAENGHYTPLHGEGHNPSYNHTLLAPSSPVTTKQMSLKQSLFSILDHLRTLDSILHQTGLTGPAPTASSKDNIPSHIDTQYSATSIVQTFNRPSTLPRYIYKCVC